MKLQFLGAARTVTGSKYLLTAQKKKFLIDCGLFQGEKVLRLRNWAPFPVPVGRIDAVVLTHAHIDHSGYLPLLVRQGFRGPIYATAATRDLCEILLRDCGRIQEEDARRSNKYGYTKHHPALPLYTEEEAIATMEQFKEIEFGKEYQLDEDLVVHASRAGHILGSAILTFRTETETLVFTGDLGRPHGKIMKEPAQIQTADYLVLESTYGNRLHPTGDSMKELGEIVRDTAKKGGTVVIPSFAVGRTQIILYLLYQLKQTGSIPDIPVYLDSPMAQNATDIMQRHSSEHRLPKDMCRDVCAVAKYIKTNEDSKSLHENPLPKVIISASGMAEGGRVLHHIRYYAPDGKNAIIFVGFQAASTRGEKMLSGASQVKIHGEMVPIRCRVEILSALSSHADYQEIIAWLHNFTKAPRMIFLTHGELSAAEALKERIEKELGWNVTIPTDMEEVKL